MIKDTAIQTLSALIYYLLLLWLKYLMKGEILYGASYYIIMILVYGFVPVFVLILLFNAVFSKKKVRILTIFTLYTSILIGHAIIENTNNKNTINEFVFFLIFLYILPMGLLFYFFKNY